MTGLKPGDRVGVGWMKDSCRTCMCCVSGDENLCASSTGVCVGGARGGFASRVRVAAAFAYPLPDALSDADAAPLLCAGITVFSPLERHVRPGTRLAVLGLGGLGHLAVQAR